MVHAFSVPAELQLDLLVPQRHRSDADTIGKDLVIFEAPSIGFDFHSIRQPKLNNECIPR
jgi:hypothetical protein